MPSTKKRINLTVPDVVYEQLQQYKEECGITNDASACLQLIVQQLKAAQTNKAWLHALRTVTPEQFAELSAEGTQVLKEFAESQNSH